tara:strand:+ start:491 stop:1090 length:600 start_codon:yes stop_codon:yes gene_type:complete
MYPLFESIRIENGVIFLIEYHQKRMDKSFNIFYKKINPWNLKRIALSQKIPLFGLYKLRIKYSDFDFKSEIIAYKKKKIETLKCVEVNDYKYPLKLCDRKSIIAFYKMRLDCDDILMIKDGLLTDTSYCNIILFNGNNWVTPESPIFEGVQRQKLLNHNKIIKSKISVADIKNFKKFKLINAMIKFEDFVSRSVFDIIL